MTQLAILYGGTSTERDVSLRSGKNMQTWCELSGYTTHLYDLPNDLDRFLHEYREHSCIIPVFHGKYGEDGQITAFLRTLGCHVAYSPFEVHTLCIDKHLTNLTLAPIGIHIPTSHLIKKDSGDQDCDIPYPRIIKPNTGGSSIATHKVHTPDDYTEALRSITDDDILVQSCIEGREFTVGVYFAQGRYHTLPIIEIRTLAGEFFDYTEKYETDGSNEVFMISEEELQKVLSSESIRICEYIGTKGVVRIDYRYDGENIYFLEVNTIPGFTEASLVPKMWKKAGKTEKEFVEMLAGSL